MLERTILDSPHGDFIWWDGQIIPWEEATIHVGAVGHASVPSVFEGIKAYWNSEQEQLYLFRLREHLERFMRSLRMARLVQPYSVETLTEAIVTLLRQSNARHDTYVRPWVFAKTRIQKVMAPVDCEASVVIATWPFQTRLLTSDTCRVCVSSWRRINETVASPRIKAFANYYNGRIAEMEATLNGYTWPIILNERDKVSEGPAACVGLVKDGVFITPHMGSGVLQSITRDTFLALAPGKLGLPVQEREVDRAELYDADELFFMGTGRELWPIVEVDRLCIGNGEIGPVSRQLGQEYHDIVRGISDVHQEWTTPVW